MTKRLTYEFVKIGFEKRGYALLEDSYINSDTKMRCLCPELHECFVSWHSLNGGRGCHECGLRKPSMGYLRKLFSSKGLLLISKEYVNAVTKLKYKCEKCGCTGSSLLCNVLRRKKGLGCSKCVSISRRPDKEYVKRIVEGAGHTFLELIIEGSTSVVFECCNGRVVTTTWYRFLHLGKRCPRCNLSKLYTLDEIKSIVEKEGYELVSDVYLGNKKNILLKCSEGHEYTARFNYFQQGNRCPECSLKKVREHAITRRTDVAYIYKCFEEAGYSITEMEYIDARSPILCLCDKGHEYTSCWNVFQRGHRCPICAKGSISNISQRWLDAKKIPREFREFTIFCGDKKIRVDGFDPATNTIYEFLGDFWHGNPNVYDQDNRHRVNRKTYGQLFDETMARLFLLRQHGYNLEIIWEEDFRKWHK